VEVCASGTPSSSFSESPMTGTRIGGTVLRHFRHVVPLLRHRAHSDTTSLRWYRTLTARLWRATNDPEMRGCGIGADGSKALLTSMTISISETEDAWCDARHD